MPKTRAQKEQIVEKIADQLTRMKAAAFITTSGYTMTDADSLRAQGRELGVELTLAKKTLLLRALQKPLLPYLWLPAFPFLISRLSFLRLLLDNLANARFAFWHPVHYIYALPKTEQTAPTVCLFLKARGKECCLHLAVLFCFWGFGNAAANA